MATQELTQAMTQENSSVVLPTDEFDLEKLHTLYENSPQKIEGKKVVKDITNCKNYVTQYFYPLNTSEHMFYNSQSQSFELKTQEEIKNTYLNRFPTEVKTYYLQGTRILYMN